MNNKNHTTLAAVLIVLALIADFKIFTSIVTNRVPEADYSGVPQDISETETPEQRQKRLVLEDIQNNFTDVTAGVSDTKCGELILVNNQYNYDFNAQPALFEREYPESIYESKTGNYYVKNINLSLNKIAILALNELLDDFYTDTGHDDIIVVDGYRTYEWQKVVLDAKIQELGEEQGRLIAANPGASEHHTGYALDLSLFIDGIQREYDGTGDYEWITNNCYKYGFVIRYPEGKTGITGIDYEPWHLRYVGKPHAQYMTENNLCLEEYIQKLALYPIDSARLKVNTHDGGVYEIYSVEANADEALVKVPKNYPYTVSGDNCGHIIVTVDKSQSGNDVQPEQQNAADNEQ